MRKEPLFTFLLILLLSLLLDSCWLNKPKETECLIDQETKAYCLFGQGSYWIYQDSATLKIDSVVINNPIRYELEMSKGNNSTLENYFTDISLYSQDSIHNVFHVGLG